jgi:hypothetical protein
MNKNSTLHKYTLTKLTTAFFALLMLCCTAISTQAQVTYTENFATGGPHPGGGNLSLPSGWSQGKVGAGIDLDNRWDRPQGNVTGTGSANNTNPIVAARNYFASATGWTYNQVAGSYSMTISGFAHTLTPGTVIHVDFAAITPTTYDGTYTVATVPTGTSFTITMPDAVGRAGTARWYYDSNLRYYSDLTNAGEAAYVASKRLDFSGWSAGTPTVSFWMYRDGTSALNDNIQVFFNDSAIYVDAGSATPLVENTTLATTISRYYLTAPTATVNTWVQYTYNLNIGAVPVADRDNMYIVIVGTSAFGSNINIDDFSVQTWPTVQTVTSAAVILQNTQTTAAGALNQDIIGVKVSTQNAAGPMHITDMTFNYNGSTNAIADIAAAKLYYNGGTPTFDPANSTLVGVVTNPNATNFSFSINATVAGQNAQMPGSGRGLALDNGDNFFFLAYDIRGTAISGNFVDAEWSSFTYGYQKAMVNGVSGTNTLTLASAADNVGLATTNTLVTGSNIPVGTTVTGIAGAVITLSANLTGAVTNAYVLFTPTGAPNPITPNPFALAGDREIDQVYCVGVMSAGTSWATYTNNDYIRMFRFDGDNGVYTGIYTGQKASTTPGAWPNPTTYNNPAPNAGDCDGTPFNITNCPFTSHPPDYELFAASSANRTTTNLSFNTPYVMHTYAGTWGSSNYLAAWMDFNKASGFNQTLFMATNVCGNSAVNASANGLEPIPTGSVTAGSPNLSVTLPVGEQVVIGTRVYGTHIPTGAIVTGVNPGSGAVVINMGFNATVTSSGPVYFINPAGEKLFQSCSLAGQTDAIATIYIPDDIGGIIASNLRLRVREVYAVSDITPCGGWTWGETEDYTVTLKPACVPTAFGAPINYTRIWLGVADDDWSNPVNWCGGVPTIGDPAAIPSPTFLTAGAFSPTIKAGVQAAAKALWIGPNQTVTVDAPGTSSLSIADSIHISAATSRLRIVSSFTDTAQVNNGNISHTDHFFKGGNAGTDQTHRKARAIWLFRPADLSAKGLLTGDQITNLVFNIFRQNLPTPGVPPAVTGYMNAKVKMYYVNPAMGANGFAVSAFVQTPQQLGMVVGPEVTVFTGNITDNIGKAHNTEYQRVLPLSTNFTWNGGANWVAVDMSYDNDGVGVSPTGVDNIYASPTLLFRGYALFYPTAPGSPAAETLTRTTAFTQAVVPTGPNWRRPNITFEFIRPYQTKFPIEVGRNWHNNGIFEGAAYLYRNTNTFMPPATRVSFVGPLQSSILGTTQTQFNHLRILKATAINEVRRYTNFSVDDTLDLMRGRLALNGDPLYPNSLVTVSNATNTAVIISRSDSTVSATYPGGYLESESTSPPYGNIRWNMGGTPGIYRFPFVQRVADGGSFVPFEYELISGTGDITAATYKTPLNNLPLPLQQSVPLPVYDDVTHLLGQYTGTPNDANTVDRFWMINNAATGTAHLKFRFAANEEPAPSVAPYRAQRWDPNGILFPGSGGWEPPAAAQSYGSFTVVDSSLSNYSNVWTLAGQSTPLPVELLEFTAVPVKDQVRINWTTASEFNNDYFEIERSVNQSDFTFIDRVKSKGASVNTQKYETFDMQPLQGLQYYWLRQYDYDGTLMSYGPVPVNFGKDRFEIVTALITSNQQGITVVFDYDTNEPYNYTIVDMLGQVVTAKGNNKAVKGVNVIDIPVNMSSGIYQIVLQNSTKTVSRKIMY